MNIIRLFFIVVVAFVFSSCTDKAGISISVNYYIKANINGELTEYKIDANASLPTNGNRISGYAKAKQNQPFPAFDFEITDPTGIKSQTYAEPNIDMIFRIALESTKTYHSQSGGVEDFKINITEITNNHIKGTFSGSVFLAQTMGNENFKLTDGEFFLKRD